MAERRATTLLDFAIAASVAVLPVLTGVLLAVAVVRPLDPPAASARDADRYVSARELAALKTFELAIVRRDTVMLGPPTPILILDRVPQCRHDWDGRGGLLARLRASLTRSTPPPSTAEKMAAQLADLDQDLVRFSTRANRRVSEAVGFDSLRWFEAVRLALEVPIEAPEYPGRAFTVHCADIAGAVAALTRAGGRMLEVLSWRGTEVARVMAHWRPDQFVEVSAREVARANPWRGLAGCVFMGDSAPPGQASVPEYFVAGSRAPETSLCARREVFAAAGATRDTPPIGIAGEPTPDLAVDDPRWKVPPSLDAMLQSLATLRRPSGALYRLYTEAGAPHDGTPADYRYGPNRVEVHGTPVDVGFSVDLTIDPALQELAQKTAACYTGRQDVCRALGMSRAEDAGHPLGYRLLEHAMVRMAAIAVVDVASGRIEALAGALSPCAREEYDGPGRSKGCDKRLPYAPHYRPDALLNPAVFFDAMPASVIKPIMAEAFLTDPAVGARWLAAERAQMRFPGTPSLESMRGELMRSASARFLDRMFCADKGFAPCARPWEVQAMAASFGWNSGCAMPREDCGKRDLLFGRAVAAAAENGKVAPLATIVPFGRLLAEPLGGRMDAPFRLRPAIALDPARVRACAAAKWEKCRGGVVVDVVAEGWGQGHARASALGVAGMMQALAAAANGQESYREPHIVAAIRGVGAHGSRRLESAIDRFGLAEPQPVRLSQDAAQVILSGLSYSHRAGTARRACEQVFDPKTCQGIDWLAGKTGTPTFPNDDRSLDELWRLCGRGRAKTKSELTACGPLRPYKWYVAAYRLPRDAPQWTKVIAVLTERNWLRASGRVHGAGDHGPNPAAEIAMQIAGRETDVLQGAVP
jgi:cell division protein FtsI/penicillin-binding protein 2